MVVLHVLTAAAWIGVDVMLAVLVGAGWLSDEPATRAAVYSVIGRFVVAPMLTSALLCAATGLVLGLGTKWGLLRHWWVLVKLGITLLLCTLIVLVLRPGMDAVTAAGATIADGGVPDADLASLFFPPVVSLSALTVAVTLSVYKPWGRVRRSRPGTSRAPRPTGSA